MGPKASASVYELLMIYGAVTVSQTLSTALYVHDLVGPFFTCPRRKLPLSFLGLGVVSIHGGAGGEGRASLQN